jgi:DNA-directed RNA polymerase III subunit RPC8
VSAHDIIELGEGIIYQGDGAAYITVRFRLIVFRPFEGEILVGKIMQSNPTLGVRISLGFYDNVWVPRDRLPDPSVFDAEWKMWYWHYGEEHQLWMDTQKPCRFRVTRVVFNAPSGQRTAIKAKSAALGNVTEANAPAITEGAAGGGGTVEGGGVDDGHADTGSAKPKEYAIQYPHAPMLIFGSLEEPGLGLTKWWEANLGAGDDSETAGTATSTADDGGDGGDRLSTAPGSAVAATATATAEDNVMDVVQ